MVSVTGTLAPRLLMAFPVISQSPGIKPAALCLENPSPAEQDLAVQIQSGAQRGEQMRREVESFAEGALAKTAAVVFADIIVQRILNPKAAQGTVGCHAPPKKVRQDFARAFVAEGWTDKLLQKVSLNTVLAAIGDTWIRQLEEGLSCFLHM